MSEFDPDREGAPSDPEGRPRPVRVTRGRGRARARAAEFDTGGVIGNTFSLYFARITAYFPILAVALLPNLIATLLYVSAIEDIENMDPEQIDFETVFGGLFILFGISIVTYVLGLIGAAMISWCVFQDARGRTYTFSEVFAAVLPRIPSILAMTLLAGLGIAVGFVLCCIPGILLATMWFLAVPAIVIEGLGPVEGLGRSWNMVRTVFWPILGIWALFQLVIQGFGGGIIGGFGEIIQPEFGVALQWLATVLASGLLAVASALSYLEVRDKNEGLDAEDLTTVFS